MKFKLCKDDTAFSLIHIPFFSEGKIECVNGTPGGKEGDFRLLQSYICRPYLRCPVSNPNLEWNKI
jgi:hypothetical protein